MVLGCIGVSVMDRSTQAVLLGCLPPNLPPAPEVLPGAPDGLNAHPGANAALCLHGGVVLGGANLFFW